MVWTELVSDRIREMVGWLGVLARRSAPAARQPRGRPPPVPRVAFRRLLVTQCFVLGLGQRKSNRE